MVKTGILGGTFDPIHKGHLRLAKAAKEEYQLDEVWFMPAGDPYFKEKSTVTPASLRFEMTARCIRGFEPAFTVSDFELRQEGETYTSQTLKALNALYPDRSFYFIVGKDSLLNMHRWYKVSELFNNAVILCAVREDSVSGNEKQPPDDSSNADTNVDSLIRVPGPESSVAAITSYLKKEFPEASIDIREIHMPPYDISSTEIRDAVKAGNDISGFVTAPVQSFIIEKGLYS